MGEIADIADELEIERLVEAKLDTDLLDRLRRRGWTGKICRRVPRQCAREEKRDDDHPNEARHRGRHALEDHAQHVDISVTVGWEKSSASSLPRGHGARTISPTIPAISLSPARDNRAAGGTSIGIPTRFSASRR